MLLNSTWHGAPAVELRNDAVSLVVVPDWGGKIASIRSLPGGREWLWRNPSLEARRPEYGGAYVETFDQGGWDECFPAVRAGYYPAGPWRGAPIPDHGELWGVPWSRIEAGPGILALEAQGVRFPLRMRREMRLLPDGFALAYLLENPAAFDFPYLWCAHPLLAVAPGMALDLPAGTSPFRLFSEQPFMEEFHPPRILPSAGSFAAKAVARVYGDGSVAVSDGGAEFRISYRAAEVTHLGLWLNFGCWSGVPGAPPYYNLGLEPAIGAGDDLALALDPLREYGLAPARSERRWELRVTLKG